MAISKKQPMRSAEIEIIDALNNNADDIYTLKKQGDGNAQSIADIQAKLGDGFSEDTTVTSVTGAMSSAIQSISDEIGSGFDSDSTIADKTTALDIALEALTVNVSANVTTLGRFKIGSVEVEIEAEGNASSTVTFDAPFADDARCIVLAQVSTEELLSLFELTVIDCTYSGFD